VNSKRLFAAHTLQNASAEVLVAIAQDLELEVPRGASFVPPANWRDTSGFRLFISHVAAHSDRATRLKVCLAPYAIDAFVAHEDIEPTLEWQSEIEKALQTMDAFLAIHTVGFSKSFWTQQEIGFAIGRGVKVISFQMGEDPTGFISKQQALARRSRTAEEIAAEIDTILSRDAATADKLSSAKRAAGLGSSADEVPF
jgi:TIR domain